MAFLNENIRATIYEASEFPRIAELYNVYGVPRTVTNHGVAFDGALPESQFVTRVLQGIV